MLVSPSISSAQITELTWNYFGTDAGAWNTFSNWTDGINEPNVLLPDSSTHVYFNSEAGISPITFINFNSAIEGSPEGERNVGAISLLATNTLARTIRGNNGVDSGTGNLVIHGINTFLTSDAFPGISPHLENQVVRLALANHTPNQRLMLTSGSTGGEIAEVTMVLTEDVVFYIRDGAVADIRIINKIVNDGTPRHVTLTGGGILHIGARGQGNTFGGGMTIDNGIFEWTNSGGRAANPAGGNDAPMLIRNGTLRSTSHTSSRTFNVPIHLDGHLTFGWDGDTNNANITVNSQGARYQTVILSDSVITVHNAATVLHQLIEGDANLVKRGVGAFDMRGVNPTVLNGTFTVEEGTFRLRTVFETTPIIMKDGTRMEGLDGVAMAGVTVESGATLAPGLPLSADQSLVTRGQVTIDGLTIEPGAKLEFTLTDNIDRGHEHDKLVVTSPLDIDGVNLDFVMFAQPRADEVFVLIDNRSGAPISGELHHNGAPLSEGAVFFNVSGFVHEFQITYNYNKDGYRRSVALGPPGFDIGEPSGGYDAWREARFGDPNDPAGAPDAQAPGQLVANLMFYALGLDLAADAAAGVPVATGEATITFLRRADLEADLVVEATNGNPGAAWDPIASLSAGASTWSGSAIVTEEPAGEGLVRVTVTDTGTTDTGVRLVRLRAVLP